MAVQEYGSDDPNRAEIVMACLTRAYSGCYLFFSYLSDIKRRGLGNVFVQSV